jgi:hypothetical protein
VKWADPELARQIRCFSYGERSDVPRLQQVEQKAVRRQRNLGLGKHVVVISSLRIYDEVLITRYYFKHILLFNKKQLDRTQVSQLRNVFSNT